MTALDHLILAAPDLEQTVAWLEDGLGIRLAPGGSHPTGGTRNFLLGLGDSAYLEVLGPDTGQSVPRAELPFGLGRAELAALHGYHPALDPVRQALRAVDAELTLRRGSRPAPVATLRTPDGELTLI